MLCLSPPDWINKQLPIILQNKISQHVILSSTSFCL